MTLFMYAIRITLTVQCRCTSRREKFSGNKYMSLSVHRVSADADKAQGCEHARRAENFVAPYMIVFPWCGYLAVGSFSCGLHIEIA